tara:strand:+ start:616 stop:858 length:243 start_codon:yes stop_codon:yes gene_type:complete
MNLSPPYEVRERDSCISKNRDCPFLQIIKVINMTKKELRAIAIEMGIPAIKKKIQEENDKLRTNGFNEMADAVDALLKLC